MRISDWSSDVCSSDLPYIRFHVRTPDAIEPLVCDRRLLSQALTNIIKNAVEAIEEKSKKSDHDGSGAIDAQLDVGTGDGIRIIVTDDGIGLPQHRRTAEGREGKKGVTQ